MTSLSPDLNINWRWQHTNTLSCQRNADGSCCTCSSDHPFGFEWCVNAPAIDVNGTVFANSEDGNLYEIDRNGKLVNSSAPMERSTRRTTAGCSSSGTKGSLVWRRHSCLRHTGLLRGQNQRSDSRRKRMARWYFSCRRRSRSVGLTMRLGSELSSRSASLTRRPIGSAAARATKAS